MEAWDDGRRVRPIPIEDDDVTFERGAEPPRPPRRPSRPWLPLLIAVTAVVIVVASVTVFGALRFDDTSAADEDAFAPILDDEEGSSTTATTLPPRLDEILPSTTDRLTMIAVDEDGLWTLLWDPSFRVPKAVPLDGGFEPELERASADFDSSGRFVAVSQCVDGAVSFSCALHVGMPADIGFEPDASRVSSYVWHSSKVGAIAWIQTTDETSELITGEVNPLSGEIVDRTAGEPIANGTHLVRWDSRGFVLSTGGTLPMGGTVVTDGLGTELWRSDGAPFTASESLVGLVGTDGTWEVVDRLSGRPLDSAPAGSIEDSVVFVATSDRTDLIGRVDAGGDSLSLTVTGGGMQAPRIVTIERGFNPVGFTADAQYFVLSAPNGYEIAFVDWRTGATRVAAVPDNYRVLAIDLG